MKPTSHETFYRSVPRSFAKTDRQGRDMGVETVRVAVADSTWFRIGADVSVLRVNHAPGETILPGVREVACPRSFDKIKGMGFGRVRF